MVCVVTRYGDGDAAERIVQIIRDGLFEDRSS